MWLWENENPFIIAENVWFRKWEEEWLTFKYIYYTHTLYIPLPPHNTLMIIPGWEKNSERMSSSSLSLSLPIQLPTFFFLYPIIKIFSSL